MVARYLVAVVGAAGVTLGLLYGMSGISALFTERDPMRYFQIGDVIMNPNRGRPERIPESRAAPERARPGFEPNRGATLEPPDPEARIELPRVLEGRDLRPLLEEPRDTE